MNRAAIPACPLCGHWVCDMCRARSRGGMARFFSGVHACAKCGDIRGHMVPTRHLNSEKYADHVQEARLLDETGIKRRY